MLFSEMEAYINCKSDDNLFSDSTVQSDGYTSEEHTFISEDETAIYYRSSVTALFISHSVF